MLRLDVADPDVDWLEWTAESDGRQRLEVDRGQPWEGSYNGRYRVMRGRSQADLDSMLDGFEQANSAAEPVAIGGATGALLASGVYDDGGRWASLRWQRPDGTWLGAYVATTTIPGSGPDIARNAVLQVPQWVRVNVGYRCVADIRLGWTPPGTHEVGCRTSISATGRSYGIVYAAPSHGTFLAYSEQVGHPDAVYSIEEWRTYFLGSSAERQYRDRSFVVSAPELSEQEVNRVAGGFVELADPIPIR